MAFDPGNLPGHRFKEQEALARINDLKRSSAHGSGKAKRTSARSTWLEVALIGGAIVTVALVAGLLQAIL